MAKRRPSSHLKITTVVPIYFTMIGLVLVLSLVTQHDTTPVPNVYPYSVPLDPEGFLQLFWNVSYAEKVVNFKILIKKLKFGMIFGMSDRGEFEGADLAVLWSDGLSSYFGDAWSDENGHLHIDSHQDYQLLSAQQTPEGLYLVFRRPFTTCDPNDYLIEDGTVHLIYALLEKPFQSLSAINISSLHRGLQRVQLLKPDIPTAHLPKDMITMDVLSPDVIIPDKETTYWCYITELPEDFPKNHIVMYEPVITEGHEAIVHHMEVFQCSEEYDTFPHYSGPCDSKMKPHRLDYCRHVLAAWAMGAQAFYYPDDVGLAFGGPRSSRFLRLEVHYHNPLELKGLRDSSGIRLHYTPSLRKYDAGIMELGLVYTPLMAIPPFQREFPLTGYCTERCTDEALPSGGIHIFASQLHTHLTGRTVTTTMVRDGKEIAIVNQDKHFSPHFQEIRMLKKSVRVLPGDLLVTRCTYNTEDRSKVTVGGFSITDEMCVNYIHYYPRTELEICKSHVDPEYLKKYFSLVNNFSGQEVCTCPQSSVTEQFNKVPWNSFTSKVLDSLYNYSPISMHCNKSSAVRFPGDWEKQPLPEVTQVLAPTPAMCQCQEDSISAGPAFVNIKNLGHY
ncbi:dopamine beta-hydroxylase [Bufo gargarizans]|uniref:dopamine beta-hydroxylase n=1 Tax=Bufo gargarizans TaxID=30331 RepID=UPI001CF0EA1C|nr:dopamine beta-hydroxylase [Bufo gargarizans]XP_044124185.1 dopamine beta-hydroxylase [Bufo gargarizans]XP_044124186.1 dopamine beta-hydroxylase [Bufo gargarizans]